MGKGTQDPCVEACRGARRVAGAIATGGALLAVGGVASAFVAFFLGRRLGRDERRAGSLTRFVMAGRKRGPLEDAVLRDEAEGSLVRRVQRS